MNCLTILHIFFIYLIKKCLCEQQKRFITIPFQIQEERQYSSKEYTPEIYIYNNFYRNITFSFSMGNPYQKVDGIIMNDNLCFEMKLLNDLDDDYDYLKTTNNKYSPKDSYSSSLNHKELRWKKGQYYTLLSDLFTFGSEKNYNLTLLLKQTDDANIDLDSIKNQKYIIKFGLNVQSSFTGDECPNFLYYVRAKTSIPKYIISFIFQNSKEGLLVIGDDLFNYNPKIYNESYYYGVYTFNYDSFNHDEETIIDSFNKSFNLNKSDSYIKYNYGCIIGTDEYRQKIDNIFFNKLIANNTCKIQLVKFNESSEYYIYICKENINLKMFPKLVFFSRLYRFNFELNYQDLFVKKFDNNIYFLVLFRANQNNKDDWILGEPFYKKYTFSFNLDAKIVGFYNKILTEEKNNQIEEKNKVIQENNNKTIMIILISIFGVIFITLLMIISFYFGKRLREKRRKRANELKEDNYEYFPESEKDNNKLIN